MAAPGERGGVVESAGFDPGRLERARELCREATGSGAIPGIALAVARHGELVQSEAWGSRGPARDADPPAAPDTIWLIASVTKPVVCAGICLLLERGELALDDPVSRHVPGFDGEDRAGMTLRHLLTHSSGLPDMLPENVELRRRHAPHSEFVTRICTTPLLFPPGTGISYQSAGIALLGAITERVTGLPCREFLRREFFEPLGMDDCALGWRPEFQGRVAAALLAADQQQQPSDWDWNSAYWRNFGAPWGGMYATAPQFARFMQMLLAGGSGNGRRCLGPATVREITRNQTRDLPLLPEAVRRSTAWGLGWRLAAAGDRSFLGDLVSPAAYGHGGATGTGVWNDPATGVSFVFFSNQPGCGRFIGRVANAVAGAVL